MKSYFYRVHKLYQGVEILCPENLSRVRLPDSRNDHPEDALHFMLPVQRDDYDILIVVTRLF